MNEESPFQQQPAYVGKTSNKRRLITVFFVVLVLIIIGLGALYLLGSSKHEVTPTNPIPTETMATPTPASSASAQLSATPSAVVSPTANPSTVRVSVLNGSGTAGAAGAVADTLKNAGFTNVTTGNANAFTYTGITVTVKKKESSELPQIQKYVESASSNAKVTTKVDDAIPSDIQIIVGK
ncbi:MAG TPA: LytR C-terminal domain-containing protein [Candidatus Saccharimonadales bacterium]|nr:LytR C-terminal domain-containing protein [Candidatus Saccharimonadales bacterium]